jgi:hypothetical protein
LNWLHGGRISKNVLGKRLVFPGDLGGQRVQQWSMKDHSAPCPYPSDLTDRQWALIEPMVPVKTGGRLAIHPLRQIVDAILYVNRTGCAWRLS